MRPIRIVVRAAPSHELGYRTRATAHLRGAPDRPHRDFGYFAARSHRVVDVANHRAIGLGVEEKTFQVTLAHAAAAD